MTLHAPEDVLEPAPRPTILEITPYAPGRSTVEGVANPVKLSANENILGCSPAARAAFLEAAADLAAYPDGRGGVLRIGFGETVSAGGVPDHPRRRQ